MEDDLASIIALLLASHEGGHNSKANEYGANMKWSGTSFKTELKDKWSNPIGWEHIAQSHADYLKDNNRKLIDIFGAGFDSQDKALNAMPAGMNSLISALHKISYLVKDRGDIDSMEQLSGNKYIPHMVGATALSDLAGYNNPDRNWSLGFSTFGTGQPGLIYTHRF